MDRYEGRGLTLFILANADAGNEYGLRELLTLFRRYGVELKQLFVFDCSEFANWFRSEQAYWYAEIFG